MSLLFLILSTLVMLAGLVGVFLPVLPGVPLVFAGTFIYAWSTGFEVITVANIIFFAVNLVTQGVLNTWLNSGGSPMPSYLIFSLIVGEVFVFLTEMITFPIFIKEHKKSYILTYAFFANLISLIAGGYIITVLPV